MSESLRVLGLRTERRVDPLGIDEPHPRLSWRIESDRRHTRQADSRVQVALTPTFEPDGLLWESGEQPGEDSTAEYAGPLLASGQRAHWRVRVADSHGRTSQWSPTASWEAGLLEPTDWTGRWIGYVRPRVTWGADEDEEARSTTYLRRSFELSGPVRRARAYATALGLYELRLNGQRVGSELLTPGWTDYHRRIQYQTYDVTDLLQAGENVLAAVLADGWYAGHMAWFGTNHYGPAPALLCQLNVELAGGQVLALSTDGSWRGRVGSASVADLLMGERIDGRLEPIGWDAPGFSDSGWSAAQLRAGPGASIVAARDEGVRVIETLSPVSTARRSRGRLVMDFGQNIAGHLRVRASGPAGATMSIRHAEVLDAKGELYTANLRTAEALDEYTFRGDGVETFEPRFTYHGFRYAEIGVSSGRFERVSANAISSAGRTIGTFECSDDLVNQIHRNVAWGLRDNFVSIPTDCPQRDERMGWAADIQVFAPSALFISDVANNLEKWLIDLADAQLPSGVYPDTAPHVGHVGAGNAGWADAGVLVPWAIYERTGDRRVLHRQYASMRRYLEYLEADQTDGIRSGGPLGDWLNLGVKTGTELIGTAYLAYTSDVFTRVAGIVGEMADVERFSRLTDEARGAFIRSFVEADGAVAGETQTGYALALGFGLLPEALRMLTADRLAGLIESNGAHLATGFLGAPLVLAALSEHGHHALACRVMRSDTFPGWGYQVRQGATTMWERWNGWTPENGFADPGMNSFNHFAFGSVADWLHRYVAGLAPAEPGYRTTRIEPRPTGEFTSAKATHDSRFGRHAVAWELDGDVLRVTVEVPANTLGEVVLPVGPAEIVVDGGGPQPELREGAGSTRLSLGSGSYSIDAQLAISAGMPPGIRRPR